MLLGLAAPTSGQVRVFGETYAERGNPASRVGAVLEASDFHPGRSGRDHLRVLALSARIRLARVDEVLGLVGLEPVAHRRVKDYSLGMCQRLGLAAALLGDPELLVLDEPANGLDPEGMRWLRDFLRGYAAQGRTVFISSHVLAEIAQTVDRVLIINRGKLVAESSLDELTEQAGAAVRIRTPAPDRMREALARASLRLTPGVPVSASENDRSPAAPATGRFSSFGRRDAREPVNLAPDCPARGQRRTGPGSW
jgi:ABC-2 type transport system ATP-binding protein